MPHHRNQASITASRAARETIRKERFDRLKLKPNKSISLKSPLSGIGNSGSSGSILDIFKSFSKKSLPVSPKINAKLEREKLEKDFEEIESGYIIRQQKNMHTLSSSICTSPRVYKLNENIQG